MESYKVGIPTIGFYAAKLAGSFRKGSLEKICPVRVRMAHKHMAGIVTVNLTENKTTQMKDVLLTCRCTSTETSPLSQIQPTQSFWSTFSDIKPSKYQLCIFLTSGEICYAPSLIPTNQVLQKPITSITSHHHQRPQLSATRWPWPRLLCGHSLPRWNTFLQGEQQLPTTK